LVLHNSDTFLVQYRQLIEASLDWGDSSAWTNEDFENLSEKIEEKTNVRLSVSTLKRIWGRVQYNSSPTAATLNALAKFLEYENWRAFQQKQKVCEAPVEIEKVVTIPEIPVQIEKPIKIKQGKKLLVAAVLGFVLIISLSLITIFKSAKKNVVVKEAYVSFDSKKTSDDLPNSVVFNYNVAAFHSDSVYLQQSWDTTRRQKIPGEGTQVTSIYYYPGYFNARLIVDGNVKKYSTVFIKTKGWKGIIEEKPVPVYLSATDIKNSETMGISASTLSKKTGSPVFNDTWVDFSNVREFSEADAADFSFETTVRNTSTVEQSLCRKIKVTIMGDGTAIVMPLCDKGCIADINLINGYGLISGKENDLSAFGCDVHLFQHLACTVKNKRIKIYLNNALISDTEQPESIGKVVGIKYAIEGTGDVKDVKLSSHGKTVYEEKF